MWRRWKAGQGKLCFVSCSHQRASAGKYLFPQTQQGLQFVQLSARTQNDGPRLLAQKLPERDNQPRIIDGPERVRNITSLFRCFTVMSDRSDHPSVPTYLRRPSCFSVRLERRFSVPACNLTERWSQRRSREARSRAEPRAAASLRRAWRARRALDLDGPLRPAQRLIRLGASELPLPLPTIPTARREAEAGSPSKSVTTTPSIAVILLTVRRRPACAVLGPCRTAGAQAGHLHGFASCRSTAYAQADLELLRRSQGLPDRTQRETPPCLAGAVRSHFPPTHRLRHAGSPAGAAACQQGRAADGAGAARDPSPHQRLRERYPLPGHPPQGQHRNPQRRRAELPRCLPGSRQDLRQARRGVLGLSREPAQRSRPEAHSAAAGTHSLPWAAGLIQAAARGFAPITCPVIGATGYPLHSSAEQL